MLCPEAGRMIKADLAEKVSRSEDLPSDEAGGIVDAIFEAIIAAIQSGDKVEIRGFGSFRIRQRNARIGRNPKTGQRVEVPAKRVPFFKPSKELRDSVNPGGVKSIAATGPGDGVDPHHPPAM